MQPSYSFELGPAGLDAFVAFAALVAFVVIVPPLVSPASSEDYERPTRVAGHVPL